MKKLGLTVDEVLTTTRAVRKRLDFERKVPFELLRECLEVAVQSPTGSVGQFWEFVFVDDPKKKHALGELYRKGWPRYVEKPTSIYNLHKDDDGMQKVAKKAGESAEFLAQNMGKSPWLMVPLIRGRSEDVPKENLAGYFGSVLPAVWSFMLAARERGLGTCWTTIHLIYEREAADILGIPFEQFTQVAMVPVAYTKGVSFRPAPRKKLDRFIHTNSW